MGDLAPMLPSLKACYRYGGKEAAIRWLDQAEWEFKAAGFATLPPYRKLHALNILCEGEAADYIDTDPRLRAAIERARNETATETDLQLVTESLQDRFPTWDKLPSQAIDLEAALPIQELLDLA
jgi:hypothetical protein